MEISKKLTVKINHKSSISGAIWCTPIGWRPTNQIDGASWIDGSWWGDEEEEAGLVFFGDAEEGDEIEADLDDLRIAECGNCRVISKVEA